MTMQEENSVNEIRFERDQLKAALATAEAERDRLRGVVNVLADRLARCTGGTVGGEIMSAEKPREDEL